MLYRCAFWALFFPIILSAQQKPAWTDISYRESLYPPSTFYIGYSQDRLGTGESISAGEDRVKANARKALSESIIVKVSGQTTVTSSSYQFSTDSVTKEYISQDYFERLSSATLSVLTNVDVLSFFDERTAMAYAFVYIRKGELEAFYASRIPILLQSAKSDRDIAKLYEESGKKKQSREKLTSALQICEEAQAYYNLLSAVNANNATLDSFSEALCLYQDINREMTLLDKGPSVYISSSFIISGTEDDAFSHNPYVLVPEITQALSEASFLIVTEEDSADYSIRLTMSTSLRSKPREGKGLLSYYANVSGRLINCRTGKEVITFSFIRNPAYYATGTSPEQAGIRAFQTIQAPIIDKILNSIEL